MWYDREHENTSLHPTYDRKRTQPNPSRLTLERRLCLAAQPSPASLRAGRTSPSSSQAIRLPQANGAQHHPRLQCPGTGGVARRILASPSTADDFPRRGIRGAAGSFASQPPRLWPPDQCVDVVPGSPDQLPTRPHSQTRLWRKCPPRAQTFGKELETRQTLDHQPRPTLPTKKNARDRLISWASQQADWAIGFLDEVWWSRFALPRLHAWQEKDQPVRLVEQPCVKGDPDPKALACYGVIWQQGPEASPIRKQMSLRFVTGRPISAMTTQFLEWCCQRLQAQGKTSWLLIWDNASFHVSKMVRTWIREHNRQAKQEDKGVRILPFFLPTKSPWLNPTSRSGSMPRRRLLNPMGCSRLNSWLSAFVLTLAAPMNLLFPLSKRLRDYALSTLSVLKNPP